MVNGNSDPYFKEELKIYKKKINKISESWIIFTQKNAGTLNELSSKKKKELILDASKMIWLVWMKEANAWIPASRSSSKKGNESIRNMF